MNKVLPIQNNNGKLIVWIIVTGYRGWLHERHPQLDINAYKVLSKPVTPRVLL